MADLAGAAGQALVLPFGGAGFCSALHTLMLRRIAPFCLVLGLMAVFAGPLLAATKPAVISKDSSPAAAISATLATLTGIAISPLLGTGAFGAYKWVTTEESQRNSLPWYAKVGFWLPALLVAGACAMKDTLGTVLPPGFKKPLDVLETIENKCSGLVAAGAVVPFTMDAISKMLLSGSSQGAILLPTGFATIGFGAIDFSWALNLLTVPFGIAVFCVVWMASHAINVLILLSPWGAIDAALKASRTALLGLVTLSTTLNPWVSATLSIVVIIVSWLIAGWAFRLTVFGSLFCWDFFTLRKRRYKVGAVENKVFSGNRLCSTGVPTRTYGRWVNEPQNGRWRFVYRPWLFLPERSVDIPATKPHVGKGLFISTLLDGDATLLIMPPRYRGHEAEVVHTYGVEGGIQDAGLLKAWSVLRELFGGASSRAQVV